MKYETNGGLLLTTITVFRGKIHTECKTSMVRKVSSSVILEILSTKQLLSQQLRFNLASKHYIKSTLRHTSDL